MMGCIGALATSRRREAVALLSLVPLQLALAIGLFTRAAVAAESGPTRFGAGSTTPTSVSLTWTAVGDDSTTGTATYYDLRYATEMITEENWDAVAQVLGEPTPQPAGAVEAFTVTDLEPATTYYFALKVGDEVPNWSALSNIASAATQALPDSAVLALSDSPVAGTVSGDYTLTFTSDSVHEVITEVASSTNPRKWYSTLEHRWHFGVAAGTSVTFHLEAYRPDNPDGDDFAFEYSTDGSTFTRMVTVASPVQQSYSVELPANLSGDVCVRVVDTNRVQERRSLDQIYVDYMDIETTRNPLPPVADFAGVPTPGFVPLAVQFTDLSTGAPSSWSWAFGDSQTSTLRNPGHLYSSPGRYTVTLTAANTHGTGTETKVEYIIVAEPGGLTMHVHDLVVTRGSSGVRRYGICQAWIQDQAGQPVIGAVVHASYTGPTSGAASGITGPDGSTTIESARTKPSEGEWCFAVTDVAHDIYTYDPVANLVTSACENGPLPLRSAPPSAGLSVGLSSEQSILPRVRHDFQFTLVEPEHVELLVFTVGGRRAATLVDGWRPAGVHTASLDASTLASGVYFLRLEAGVHRETRRLMLIR